MRVLILNNEFPPLGGGTGVVCENFLKLLEAYPEIEADLVTTSADAQYREFKISKNVTCYGLPIHINDVHHATVIDLLKYTWKALFFCGKLIKKHKYDLSFSYSAAPAGGISLALKWIYKIPYIVSLQGPDIPGFEIRYKYIYPFLTPILRLIWNKAEAVIALSDLQRDLAHQTEKKLDITIIPNGVDTDHFLPVDTQREKECITILAVGRLIERKRIDRILHAMAQLLNNDEEPKIRCVIAGTGDEETALKRLAQELKIDNAVTFLGAVAREEMPPVYQQADIFVLPSDHEGMSIALLEALSSGLPPIVTLAGGTTELVQNGKNGLILDSSSAEDISAAIRKLIDDKELRLSMGKESRKQAEQFSWRSMSDQHIALFKRIILSNNK